MFCLEEFECYPLLSFLVSIYEAGGCPKERQVKFPVLWLSMPSLRTPARCYVGHGYWEDLMSSSRVSLVK